MALEPPSPPPLAFLLRVASAYNSLVASSHAHPETGLGGKLFYVGEIDDASRALLVAANIAGAATLAATADRAAQKQALRDGVADFVVNNLDEALRILKNQLRKRETVAVLAAQPPSEVESEMNDRGVSPDLWRGDIPVATNHDAFARHEGEETEFDLSKIPAVVTWRVESSLPKDLAILDEIALACLDPGDWKSRRWLRLAPRYLGRMAQGLRLLDCNREFAARFSERVFQCMERGEIAFAFEILSYFRGIRDEFRYAPPIP